MQNDWLRLACGHCKVVMRECHNVSVAIRQEVFNCFNLIRLSKHSRGIAYKLLHSFKFSSKSLFTHNPVWLMKCLLCSYTEQMESFRLSSLCFSFIIISIKSCSIIVNGLQQGIRGKALTHMSARKGLWGFFHSYLTHWVSRHEWGESVLFLAEAPIIYSDLSLNKHPFIRADSMVLKGKCSAKKRLGAFKASETEITILLDLRSVLL